VNIAVIKEIAAGERRVALDPDRVARLVKSGFVVHVQAGAGTRAFFMDETYERAGATLVKGADQALEQADVVLKVDKPVFNEELDAHELDLIPASAVLIGLLSPLTDAALVQKMVERKLSAFSMDLVPRIARAQKMDALSSMSSLAGYKAVLVAANALGKYFPMLMTAAGTIPPAKVLILGAGVAGLQAIATAHRLGATVSAYDVRPAVKEQVQSLGATFIELELEESAEDAGGYAKELSAEAQRRGQELVGHHVEASDVVITTAQIPGRPAPLLVPEAMVKTMRPGSVVVDLAAETGGNCELTQVGKVVEKYGVSVHGLTHVPSSMPLHASQLYARNVLALFEHLVKENEVHFDFEDEVTREACVTHQGNIVSARVKALYGKEVEVTS